MNMNPKTKTLFVLLLSFVLGCVIGASVLPGLWRSVTRSGSDRGSYRDYIHKKLSLDSVQKVQVDSVLDAYSPRFEVYRLAMQQTRDTLRSDLQSFLREDQKERYRQMVEDMNKRGHRKASDTLQSK
jgi:hypothetical protein